MHSSHPNWPDFILVGAAKAGTTAIAHYLNEHPGVYFSPIKEPNYFSRADIHLEHFRELLKQRLELFDLKKYLAERPLQVRHAAYVTEESDYLELFRDAKPSKLKGEASVSYLNAPSASAAILKANPNTKIIIVLRNPIARAFSHYLMDLRINFTALSFRKAVEEDLKAPYQSWNAASQYISLGLYTDQVKRYLQLFPANQVKIILHDDLKLDALKTVQEIYSFLEIDSTFVPNLEEKHNESFLFRNDFINALYRRIKLVAWINKKINPKFKRKLSSLVTKKKNLPTLSQEDKEFLLPYFTEDIHHLEMLINRDLSSWLKL
jgi:Sulfotransferase family